MAGRTLGEAQTGPATTEVDLKEQAGFRANGRVVLSGGNEVWQFGGKEIAHCERTFPRVGEGEPDFHTNADLALSTTRPLR
jgi:hypothetical protein